MVPGNTKAEQFDNALRIGLAVHPEAVTKEKKRG
jgi:hypothetical protein